MKIDLLPNVFGKVPIVRLYEYTDRQMEKLAAAVLALSDGAATSVNLSAKPWAKPMGGIMLSFEVAPEDTGLVLHPDQRVSWQLRAEVWGEVFDQIEGLKRRCDGFAWLDVRDSAALLLSPNGQW